MQVESRLKIVGAGEGAGKSRTAAIVGLCRPIYDALTYGLTDQLVWVVGQDFKDARVEFQYIHELAEALGVVVEKHISSHDDQKVDMVLKYVDEKGRLITKVKYETISAGDPTNIGRLQPEGIIGCEISRWPSREPWRRCMGRLARKFPRAWGYFTGSFDGAETWFAAVFNQGMGENAIDLVSFNLPSWANRAIYPGGFDDPAIQTLLNDEPLDRFLERYGGRPSPARDNVIPEFRPELHISRLAVYDKTKPVYLFVDPAGHTSVYAVLFVQFQRDQVNIVDEVYAYQKSHAQIMQLVKRRPAYRGVVQYGNVMDVAGQQHHDGMMSAMELWRKSLGINFMAKRRDVASTVDAIRDVMQINLLTGRPYLQISPDCPGILAELGAGLSPVPNAGRWKMKNLKPSTDNCDSLKALGYGLQAHMDKSPIDLPESYTEPVSYIDPVTVTRPKMPWEENREEETIWGNYLVSA